MPLKCAKEAKTNRKITCVNVAVFVFFILKTQSDWKHQKKNKNAAHILYFAASKNEQKRGSVNKSVLKRTCSFASHFFFVCFFRLNFRLIIQVIFRIMFIPFYFVCFNVTSPFFCALLVSRIATDPRFGQ